MGAYIAVGIVSVAIVGLVVGLSLATLSKGYGYKHSIDPLPAGKKEEDLEEKNKK
ncbi:YtzI protein [Oceanobacillus damuensis]|uniref:YtzI protein n=1 Tax=Oceanobacillus damuensis TaxID=937928 RepID=UPI0009FDFD34|nr:YtzI protein [Oceanobacillus damuensis]